MMETSDLLNYIFAITAILLGVSIAIMHGMHSQKLFTATWSAVEDFCSSMNYSTYEDGCINPVTKQISEVVVDCNGYWEPTCRGVGFR